MIRRGFLRLLALGLAAAGCARPTWSAYPTPIPIPPASPLWHQIRWWEHESPTAWHFSMLVENRVTGETRYNGVRAVREDRLIEGYVTDTRRAAQQVLKGWLRDLNDGVPADVYSAFYVAGEPKTVHFLESA